MTGQGKYRLCQDGNIYYLGVLSRGILALKAIKGHSCPGSVKGHCGFKEYKFTLALEAITKEDHLGEQCTL